jgi:hypothetical protein
MPRVSVEYSQTSRSTYKLFCKEHKELKLSYLEFVNIIYTFNYGFRDYLLETGMKGKLPWGIGDFAISKRRPKQKKILEDGYELICLPVDWKKTREHGKKIYHLNTHSEGFKFRIKWFHNSVRFIFSEIWNFKPSRVTSRLIKHYITQGHQHRYYEWDSVR